MKKPVKIFITGGTGFIGQHVVSLLKKEGYRLLVLTRTPETQKSSKQVTFLRGDLQGNSWKQKVAVFNPDATIHLAWERIPNYSAEIGIKNTVDSLNLFRFLAQKTSCKKIICAGSSWEYGNLLGNVSEKDIPPPYNAFTVAKWAIRTLGKELSKDHAITFVWTYLFYVYGPGQKSHSLIPHLINCADTRTAPTLKTPGAQNDFIYVEDVARGLLSLLEKTASSGEYNIGSGKLSSVREIQKELARFFPILAPDKKTARLPGRCASIAAIKKETGWKPTVSLRAGIQKTVKSYAKN